MAQTNTICHNDTTMTNITPLFTVYQLLLCAIVQIFVVIVCRGCQASVHDSAPEHRETDSTLNALLEPVGDQKDKARDDTAL